MPAPLPPTSPSPASLASPSAWLAQPRRLLGLIAAACVGLLVYGLYLQHGVGLEPCPMCIVQRYCLLGVGLAAAFGAALTGLWARTLGSGLGLALAGLGAFTAARQSWLQWYPPQTASCGRDFYGMIESFPLQRAIPMIFRGSGDCSAVDWTFLGGTIANWSFLWFLAFGVVFTLLLVQALRGRAKRLAQPSAD
jgi:disulfide bond formation protein DsbB